MLVRRLSVSRARGAAFTGWFCFLNAVYDTSAVSQTVKTFDTMGLHNDVYRSGVRYSQEAFGWPRPAWYAYRRLVWVLERAPTVEVVFSSKGFVVLRFTASSGGFSQGPEGAFFSKPFTYGYMAWVDQHAGTSNLHPLLQLRSGGGSFVLVDYAGGDAPSHTLGLVPTVSGSTTFGASTTDSNGYAENTPDWHWAGWNAAGTVTKRNVTFDGGTCTVFSVDIAPADPASCIAPFFFLTNASHCLMVE